MPLRQLFALCSWLCTSTVVWAQGAPPPPQAGTLVVLGGAVKDNNDTLWQAVVQAAGGAGALVLVLPTASANPESAARLTAEQLQRRGARTETLPIAPHWPGSSTADAQAQAHHTRWVDLIARANGVWMTGGEQDRLMDVLRPEGRDTPVLQALRALLARGGVVAGTSAGAAVMSETAIRGLDDPFEALLRPLNASELGTGFGFAPHDVVTDQHFLKRGRIARLVRVLLQSGRTLGLGVEENSAAVLRGGTAQALGARGLLVVDSSAAEVLAAAPLHVRGLRLSYVDSGDHFNLLTRQLQKPTTRQALKIGQSAGPAAFFGDILGDNIIVGALAQATESVARPSLGLAWRQHQGTAFEWHIEADGQTRAYGGPTRDDHSLERLRLDITPARLAQPVYERLSGPTAGPAAAPGAASNAVSSAAPTPAAPAQPPR